MARPWINPDTEEIIASFHYWYMAQWRGQNFEKGTHFKGRLLYQAMDLYNYVPFRNGNFSELLFSQREQILSFKSTKM